MEKGSPTYHELGKKVLDFGEMIGDHRSNGSDYNAFLNPDEYKSIIELSVMGILIGDCHGKIISWNNAIDRKSVV